MNYQKLAARTWSRYEVNLSSDETKLLFAAVGIAGEAGEVVDYLKKGIFHRHGIDSAKVQEELGDLLWYIAAMATQLGVTLEDIMAQNIAKLERRYPEGFDCAASRNRQE